MEKKVEKWKKMMKICAKFAKIAKNHAKITKNHAKNHAISRYITGNDEKSRKTRKKLAKNPFKLPLLTQGKQHQ